MMTESDRKGSVGKSAPQTEARDSGSRGDQFTVAAPSISLPKGGGAIRSIGEKFAANPVTGSGSMSVPIATSPGRSGFGPRLSLSYDSGSGAGPFGFGWSLSLPSITRKTDKGLPQYIDTEDSDVFILSGAEDLVPALVQNAQGEWERENLPARTVNRVTYRVDRYRPRIEGLFARIERWTNIADATDVFWRSISKDNITTWYGKSDDSRIFDPSDNSRIFSWLICQSYDDKGNVIVYRYKEEDSGNVDLTQANERNRIRSANRYPKRIYYGNREPYLPVLTETEWPQPPDPNSDSSPPNYYFEVVFDYEDGHYTEAAPDPEGRVFAQPVYLPSTSSMWLKRADPFSTYRPGFEVRTYRLCQRVLMFHHFPAELGATNCLVRSTDFTYSYEDNQADASNPIYSFLDSVSQSGYLRYGNEYLKKSLPPVQFEYTKPVVQEMVEEVDQQSLENLPIGLDGGAYRWTDLHGEGIPGILTEQAGAWFYKRNWSPIPVKLPDGSEVVKAKFSALETVALKPDVALSGGSEFMDLAGDGQPDVVVMEGPAPGLFEHDDAESWQPFRPFTSRLNRDMRDPNLKFIDLDGDGHADVLITEDDAFVWHASLAEEGFGPARRVAQALDEEKGPRIVFADGTQSIYLADLSGDGLTDIVRIRNGEVCYWPNLGHGRFGAKVTMDNTPLFDHPDQFDHKRICLADIDGSGTTDIIYLCGDGVRLYFNQSGNSWSHPNTLKVFPRIDDLMNIAPTDLLGDGTACLVWSSPLPGDARRPMRYVNLMGRRKPHLLVKAVNNLGAETRVEYAPSTRFYLQDKRDGKPWITRLPFPVHVVERVETYDHISRNRFVTRYAYHHGYFDGEEREFRGFGMVEQWDTETFSALSESGTFPIGDNVDESSHVPPVLTRNWFHTGVSLGRERVSDLFAGLLDANDKGEYYREPGLTDAQARSLLLDDTVLPDGLTPKEEREACRALKGSMLRQEVYALDGTGTEDYPYGHPYTVTEQNFTIRMLQPRRGNSHGVFFTHARESLSYHYEREPSDPRIGHSLTLEVDDFGNVLKSASIGYGRRELIRVVDNQGNVTETPNPGLNALDPPDRAKQTQTLITYTENRVTRDHDTGEEAIDADDDYRTPLPCEALTFELTGYAATGPAGRYQASDLVEPDPAHPGRLCHKFNSPEVLYEATASGNQRRRPIERLRTLYRRDNLNGLLPFGALQPLALPGESYKLAFTPGLLDQVFQRPRQDQPDEPLLSDQATVLGGKAGRQGGYVDLDGNGHWWIPSGRLYYHTTADVAGPAAAAAAELTEARQHFFLPKKFTDPFDHRTTIEYDAHDLAPVKSQDALDNVIAARLDYRTLQPKLITDPNGNRNEVEFDALGMVVATAVRGKKIENLGDLLEDFDADPPLAALQSFVAGPRGQAASLLGKATTRIVYDLDRFHRCGQPPFAATLARETHYNDPGGQQTKIQVSFSYSDGFGREIQKKIQAEAGDAPQRQPDIQQPSGDVRPGALIPDVNGDLALTNTSRRWVGTGRAVFNNKGKPVKQYEPFFSSTSLYEDEHEMTDTGVSPVLFYDPVERVVATLHPNHTYEKVVFDPWRQTTYDVNDTCAPRNAQTGDPRTDPDIQGYVAEYFETQPANWKTWIQQRIIDPQNPPEDSRGQTPDSNAAVRALAHADTPTTAYFDALGRAFLTVARNRVVCQGHALDGKPDEEFGARVELDIEGNQREVRDERKLPDNYLPTGAIEQRIVMRYDYDMLGNRIRQQSMEAGARWMLNDVAGKPIRAWDSRGHNFTTVYDALRRPTEQYVRGTFSDPDPLKPNSDRRTLNLDILVDKIEYGEPPPDATPDEEADAQGLNLRTRIYRHLDSAGEVLNAGTNPNTGEREAYDFKGNVLRSTRRLATQYQEIPNWGQPAELQLDEETFEGSTRYDALNRPTQSVAPHSSVTRAEHTNKFNIIQPVFNEANLLEQAHVWLEQPAEPPGLLAPDTSSPVGVADIDYDAKGHRTLIDYKTQDSSVIRTTYTYDPETSRLTHLYTRRGVDPETAQGVAFDEDCDNTPTITAPEAPPEGKPCGLQNLHYTYDPAGNITHIRDDAQQTIYFKNQRVEPSNDYTYDALYRLIQAKGREHLGQGGAPIAHSYNDAGRVGFLSANPPGQFAPNDRSAMARYTERYVYDAAGNFLQMRHERRHAQVAGWTRRYDYAEASLIEPAKQSNRLSRTTVGNSQAEVYGHDAHGNMLQMPQLQAMQWDYKDQLQMTQRQRVNIEDADGDAHEGERAYYVYDASGQRVRKVWEKNGGALIEERIYLGGFEIFRKHSGSPINSNTATLERETLHVMDDKQRIALVETRTLDRAGNDEAPPQLIRYQFGNHLGSASLELDDQAKIISYEEYAPYGGSTYQAVRRQTETAKRYRYTGKERDEESGLSYHRARYYSSWLLRWVSVDPYLVVPEKTATPKGPSSSTNAPKWVNEMMTGKVEVISPARMNSYCYSLDNPLNLLDPDGAEPTREKVGEAKNVVNHVQQLEKKYTAELKGKKGSKTDITETVNSKVLEDLKKYPTFNNPGERYVYTKRGGWIDMAHFARATSEVGTSWWRNKPVLGFLGRKLAESHGRDVEYGQALSPKPGSRNSAYSYEDLPSNLLGFEFGRSIDFSRPLSTQLEQFFQELQAAKPQIAPNWKDLPKKDNDTLTREPPRNLTSKPVFTIPPNGNQPLSPEEWGKYQENMKEEQEFYSNHPWFMVL